MAVTVGRRDGKLSRFGPNKVPAFLKTGETGTDRFNAALNPLLGKDFLHLCGPNRMADERDMIEQFLARESVEPATVSLGNRALTGGYVRARSLPSQRLFDQLELSFKAPHFLLNPGFHALKLPHRLGRKEVGHGREIWHVEKHSSLFGRRTHGIDTLFTQQDLNR